MMNEKQAKKWEEFREDILFKLAIRSLILLLIFLISYCLADRIIGESKLSFVGLVSKNISDIFRMSWIFITLYLFNSHWQEKRYQKYLEANKKGKNE